MADTTKKYLDLEGLQRYHAKITSDIDEKIGDINVATEDTAGLVKPGDGLELTGDDGSLKVKAAQNGSIKVNEDGVDVDWTKGQKAGTSTAGLVTVGDGLDVSDGKISVKAKEDKGIEVDSEGVAITLKEENSGLKLDSDGLSLNVSTTGGVKVDGNGVAVDWTKAPKATSDTFGMVKIGDGLKADEDGVIEFDPDTLGDASIDLDKIDGADDLVHKSEVSGVYRFKGSVDALTDLASKESGATPGDTYDVKATGMNYAYVESGGEYNDHWDALGMTFTITSITNSEIDALFTSDASST